MTSYQPFSTPSPLLVFPAASPSSKLRSTPTRKLPTPVDWTKEHNLIYSFETKYPLAIDNLSYLSDIPDNADDIFIKDDDEKDIFERPPPPPPPNRNLSNYRRHSTPEFLNLYNLPLEDDEDDDDIDVDVDVDVDLLSARLSSFKYTCQNPTFTPLKNLRPYLESNDIPTIASTSLNFLPIPTTTTTDTTLIEKNTNKITNKDDNNNNNNTFKNLISSCYSSPNASLISLTSSISSSYVSSYSNSEQSSSNNNTSNSSSSSSSSNNSNNNEHLFNGNNEEGPAHIQSILLENRRGRKKRSEIPFPYQEKRKSNHYHHHHHHHILINHDNTFKTSSSNSTSTTIRERNYHAHFVKKKSRFSQLVSKMKRAAERPFKLIEQ